MTFLHKLILIMYLIRLNLKENVDVHEKKTIIEYTINPTLISYYYINETPGSLIIGFKMYYYKQ